MADLRWRAPVAHEIGAGRMWRAISPAVASASHFFSKRRKFAVVALRGTGLLPSQALVAQEIGEERPRLASQYGRTVDAMHIAGPDHWRVVCAYYAEPARVENPGRWRLVKRPAPLGVAARFDSRPSNAETGLGDGQRNSHSIKLGVTVCTLRAVRCTMATAARNAVPRRPFISMI